MIVNSFGNRELHLCTKQSVHGIYGFRRYGMRPFPRGRSIPVGRNQSSQVEAFGKTHLAESPGRTALASQSQPAEPVLPASLAWPGAWP